MQSSFSRIIVDADPGMTTIARQCLPVVEGILNGIAEQAFGRLRRGCYRHVYLPRRRRPGFAGLLYSPANGRSMAEAINRDKPV